MASERMRRVDEAVRQVLADVLSANLKLTLGLDS